MLPSTLRKNFNLCFTKIKRPLNLQPSNNTSPMSADYSRQFPSTTASILFTNINSLDDHTFDSTAKSCTLSPSSEPDMDTESEPDFATVLSSERFFFSSPGGSNSIIDSSPSIATAESSEPGATDDDQSLQIQSGNAPTVNDIVAVSTFSRDPFMEFRRSMQEIVEARDLVDVKANWDNLHELLLCYLALNPKSTHKFITRAFADLLVSLMVDGGSIQKRESSNGGRSIPEQCTCNIV
ncbi:hypothetical protein SLEP1_g36886 [Rubroshorea leprosula]|uniref:Transcription repressor n=1 Tax=Rubroshorea leprosula TaxID=152421 RepID=A0AAV5KT64_9ROSI|nr:hypothetical protein SLEP1_g36886 [Rubroshorea leprosula]